MTDRELNPYYVRRVPVWGGRFRLEIAGEPRFGSRQMTPLFDTEAPARKLCDRMNWDYRRYYAARLALPGDR